MSREPDVLLPSSAPDVEWLSVGDLERLTLDQAIAYLGCSRSWFFRHVRPFVAVYKLHREFFAKADLDRFIESRRQEAQGRPAIQGKVSRTRVRAAGDTSWEDLADKHGLSGKVRRLKTVSSSSK